MKFLRKFLHPLFAICLIWFLFASPYFLQGKVPFSSTYQTTFFPPWSAYPHDGMPVKNAAMPDVIGQIYPWRHLVMDTWKLGQVPLWNPYSFSGTPLLANDQSAALSPLNLLFLLLPFIDGWSLLVLLQPLLAGIFMYCFVRLLQVSRTGSLISAISFMFCGFLVVWMGYGTLGYVLLFLPLGLYAMESFFLTQKIRFLILLTFVVPLSFFSGHFQISIYMMLALLSYAIIHALQKKSWKNESIVLLYLFFGVLISFLQLLPSFEFYMQSLRSNLFQKIEVIPWQYLPTFIAPDFFGNPVTRNDWFGHYAEWNTYIGIFPLFFAFLGWTKWKNHFVQFAIVGGIVALLLAFPTPLQDLLVALRVPVLATSALSRIVCLYSFFFAVLAGFGWDAFIQPLMHKEKKKLAIWIALCLLCFLPVWFIVIGKIGLPLATSSIAKQNLLFPSLLFGIGIIVMTVGLFLPRKVRYLFLATCFLVLVGFDMLRFATKWQPFDPKQLVFSQVGVTDEFTRLAGYNRALGNYLAEVSNYYHVPSVEGYDALYPRRYGEFIASVNSGTLQESARSVVAFPKNGKYAPQAINLLNVTYIVHKLSDDNAVWTFPYWQYPNNQFVQIFQDNAYRVLQNTKAFPHAFLVGSYVVRKDNQEILDTIFHPDFNLRDSIVLEENPHISISPDQDAKATITKYTPDDVSITTQAKSNMFLFLSDTYFPGWKAYIDGKQTAIYRADYAFRAIALPKGRHNVRFVYFPQSFVFGLVGVVLGLLGVGFTGYFLKKK